MDSFRSTVVVTLSVNLMCTHLYYYSMRCLYCNLLYNTNILHVCLWCICVCVGVCVVGVWVFVCVCVCVCTLSANVMCVHLYYYCSRCLYCNMFTML